MVQRRGVCSGERISRFAPKAPPLSSLSARDSDLGPVSESPIPNAGPAVKSERKGAGVHPSVGEHPESPALPVGCGGRL